MRLIVAYCLRSPIFGKFPRRRRQAGASYPEIPFSRKFDCLIRRRLLHMIDWDGNNL
jgi:hypothetical protein